jgi:hypothetical protein
MRRRYPEHGILPAIHLGLHSQAPQRAGPASAPDTHFGGDENRGFSVSTRFQLRCTPKFRRGQGRMADLLLRSNVKLARVRWKCDLNQFAFQLLKALTNRYDFSIAEGDRIWIENKWYVTHTGLVRLACRNRCAGIHSRPVTDFCDPQTQRRAFEATVYKTKTFGFVGYGDADPFNVSYWFTVPRCAWRKPGPSTAPCARPKESASVQLRKSGPSPSLRNPPESQRSFRLSLQGKAETPLGLGWLWRNPRLREAGVIFLGRFVLPVEGQGFVRHSNQLC